MPIHDPAFQSLQGTAIASLIWAKAPAETRDQAQDAWNITAWRGAGFLSPVVFNRPYLTPPGSCPSSAEQTAFLSTPSAASSFSAETRLLFDACGGVPEIVARSAW